MRLWPFGKTTTVNLFAGDTLLAACGVLEKAETFQIKNLITGQVVFIKSATPGFVVIDMAQFHELELARKYMSKRWWTRIKRKAASEAVK